MTLLLHPFPWSVDNHLIMTTVPHPSVSFVDKRAWWFPDLHAGGMADVPSLREVIIDGGDRMKNRFSDQQLYELRNFIPIDWLIDKQLMIPCKFAEGFFRFLCPLCGEFRTATHPKTNLARCFRCERNFNTIDLVMICNHASFVESIHFLKACRNRLDGNVIDSVARSKHSTKSQ